MAVEGSSAAGVCNVISEEDLVFKEDFEAFLEDQNKLIERHRRALHGRSPQDLAPAELFKAAAQAMQKLRPESVTISRPQKLRDEGDWSVDGCRMTRASSLTTASTATGGRPSPAHSTSGSLSSLSVRQFTETTLVQRRSNAGSEWPFSVLAAVETLSECSDCETEKLPKAIDTRTPVVNLAAKGRGARGSFQV
mmetsp:Transcript_135774/g.343770  ORF Transcript_135774/g.343770 Transcript_135774/m.343770 type:complete len:194 (-) Transcript_135774:116-697(-)|eukprot:CAMPEP_0115277598 /NCGR_PEP_ID=MMETSP0270-20121206/57324_1 /TAXON_ID=71861 /ORGANISM="Scrippsiella trochoidea, Strain CCMP3099" /LENGTH=193 /DNA_ID=CAMNT_0002694247 /DNA_START=38 /DNA_END=619 /DNA_ORIENTATION=-